MENESIGILINVANIAQANGLLTLDDAYMVSKAIHNLDNIETNKILYEEKGLIKEKY